MGEIQFGETDILPAVVIRVDVQGSEFPMYDALYAHYKRKTGQVAG